MAMDLRLSELQELIRDSADDFLEREAPAARMREIEWARAPDEDLWRQMVELGWTGLPIAEAHGGQGAQLVDLGVLIEQLCRHALLSPYQQTMLAAAVMQRHGDEALQGSMLPRIVAGQTCAPALQEGNGGLFGTIEATTDGSTLSGTKRFVEFAETSEMHLVAATRDGRPGLAVVVRPQDGVSTRPLAGIGLTPQADVTYAGASVEGWIDGPEAVKKLRVLGSAISALECYAHAQRALDMTVDYVQVRVAFGRPIGTFEAVQGRCADAATLVTAARFLTYEQLYRLDQGEVDATHAAKVKSVASRAMIEATNWGHVLHGGVGFMAEYDLQFHTRRGKEASLRWGDPRESLSAVASTVLD
jgi:alkylation response protein AidB-like acyl-CoA dehydrogenase